MNMKVSIKFFSTKKAAQDYLTKINYSGAYQLSQSAVSGEWILEYEVYA